MPLNIYLLVYFNKLYQLKKMFRLSCTHVSRHSRIHDGELFPFHQDGVNNTLYLDPLHLKKDNSNSIIFHKNSFLNFTCTFSTRRCWASKLHTVPSFILNILKPRFQYVVCLRKDSQYNRYFLQRTQPNQRRVPTGVFIYNELKQRHDLIPFIDNGLNSYTFE